MNDEAGGGSGIARGRRSDDAPAYLVQRTARLLRVLFLKVVDTTETGVTPEMWRVLSRLLARDGQSQSELGAALFRDRPNTSRILNGLEQRGYVVREPDPEDRRCTRIRITPAGRAFVMERAPLAIQVRDRLYEGIRRKRLEAMRETIREIEENALVILEELDDGSFEALEDASSSESGSKKKKRKKKKKKKAPKQG